MTNLLPLEAYRDAIAFDRVRVGWVMGAFLGLSLAAAFVALSWESTCFRRDVFVSLACSVLAGATFGLVFPKRLENRFGRMVRSVYEGEGRYSTVPPGPRFTHRLPATLVGPSRLAVGGVLYAGPACMAFVPHAANLPRHREVVKMPGEALRFAAKPVRPSVLQRLFGFEARDRLVVSTDGESWEFLVPTPGAIPAALETVVAGRS